MPLDFVVPMALAYLMFTVGLDVRPGDFGALAAAPAVVLAGFAAQMLGLPLIAVAIALVVGLPGDLAVGLIILAAAPGGVTSGFVTAMVRGDVALSVVLTVGTSLAAIVSVPLVVGAALAHFTGVETALALPLGRTVAAIFVTVIVPLTAALIVARRWPRWTGRARQPLRRIGVAVFLALIGVAIAGEWRTIAAEAPRIGLAVVLLNLATMALGYGIGRLAGASPARARAILIECGLQNVALALLVAGPILRRPDLGGVATVYALVMNLSALALILALNRAQAAKAAD